MKPFDSIWFHFVLEIIKLFIGFKFNQIDFGEDDDLRRQFEAEMAASDDDNDDAKPNLDSDLDDDPGELEGELDDPDMEWTDGEGDEEGGFSNDEQFSEDDFAPVQKGPGFDEEEVEFSDGRWQLSNKGQS